MKVLIIEDNRRVIRDVQFCLQVRWPDMMIISTGEGQKGIELVDDEAPDLVIVDSTLPDIDTAELITTIREFSDVLLIVLADGQEDMDKVRCLEAGADDYINTPFSPMELLAKVKVLLRRTWGSGFNSREERPLLIGDRLSINAKTREVLLSDIPVRLTPTEYRILLELARNRGRIVSHEALLQRVWGNEYTNDIGFVKRYVYRLRQKLETGHDKSLIISERGIGYKLSQYE